MSKIDSTLLVVIFSISCKSLSKNIDKNFATVNTYFGSFLYFLNGSGVKNGQSVSKTIEDSPIFFKTSFIFLLFLKVTIPLTPNN